MKLSEIIRNSGVVGAGGAGFPTHIKAVSTVEYLLANGAECEPLLHKDRELMVHFAPQILHGMDLMLSSVSARSGIIGIKSKNKIAIDAFRPLLGNPAISICELGDFYPSGDEYELVHNATGRLIPPGGIPLNVGCVVNNVETLFNISRAADGFPVTDKILTVTGAVKNPCTFFAPIGTSFKELIEFAGGTTISDYMIFVSGVMMGSLTNDPLQTVTKTTSGLIILPADHLLVRRKNNSEASKRRIGKSACDQCSYCTELCPRYLLGYDVQPHKVMRSLVFTASGAELWNQYAELCCSCGLCSYYSCPEDLFPKEACDFAKRDMKAAGFKYKQTREVVVHPMKKGRMVPLGQLIRRIDLQNYDAPAPFSAKGPEPYLVSILLKQHAGEPAAAVVSAGSEVKKGDIIAAVPENRLGANIHATISGVVKEITDQHIVLTSGGNK